MNNGLRKREVPCCMTGKPIQEGCECGNDERVLRALAAGVANIEPLSEAERAWCIEEADQAGEGAYPPRDAPDNDAGLARYVLDAWTDYVRSNVDPNW